MSLPNNWVDRIFAKLTLVYGTDFTRRWEGLDVDDVKADWARELAMYQQAPAAIAYALENLPENKPPNVLQFRALCRAAPNRPVTPMIEHSTGKTVEPEALAEIVQQLRSRFLPRRQQTGENT